MNSSNPNSKGAIGKNRVFFWIALGTLLILLVPLIAMQFTDQVNWDGTDFVAMAALLFGAGSLFVLAARRFPQRRVVLGILFLAAFLYVWAELGVGVFTDLGS